MAQIQQQQQLLVQAQQRQRQQQQQQQQHAMMNGINVGVGNPGMIFQGQNGSPQVRGGLPNGLYAGGPPGGVPANMGGYGAGNPQMRGNVSLPPHIHQQLQQAQHQQQQAQQQQQQQQMVAQQLAMSQANAANAQASPMGMASHPQMGGMQNGLAQQQAALVAQARAQQQAQQQP